MLGYKNTLQFVPVSTEHFEWHAQVSWQLIHKPRLTTFRSENSIERASFNASWMLRDWQKCVFELIKKVSVKDISQEELIHRVKVFRFLNEFWHLFVRYSDYIIQQYCDEYDEYPSWFKPLNLPAYQLFSKFRDRLFKKLSLKFKKYKKLYDKERNSSTTIKAKRQTPEARQRQREYQRAYRARRKNIAI